MDTMSLFQNQACCGLSDGSSADSDDAQVAEDMEATISKFETTRRQFDGYRSEVCRAVQFRQDLSRGAVAGGRGREFASDD